MINASRVVNIDASPEEVFTLISDVHQCGELNPWIKVINITPEPPGAMRKGTKYHYRVVVKGKMTEYTSEVVVFEPGRLIETQTYTNPPLNITYRIDPAGEGTILEQEITTALPQQEPQAVEVPGWFSKLVGKFGIDKEAPDHVDDTLQQEEEQIRQQFQEQLNEWLDIVKNHIESQRGKFQA
ncbi:MAG: SRPBCC family protein [Gammaproteobacteria bacterium]|jgi:ribosome-associated toxin RatA of RatAB toxin-antitoxin module